MTVIDRQEENLPCPSFSKRGKPSGAGRDHDLLFPSLFRESVECHSEAQPRNLVLAAWKNEMLRFAQHDIRAIAQITTQSPEERAGRPTCATMTTITRRDFASKLNDYRDSN